ncbi:ribosome biogenesis GTPase YlqF [Glaciecola petra]|uniref:Ribosome biogenesis GTPase A n=1 Tax=Glaciecola petra TaxID=3075602 RepID=A0ABU2ZPM7_9ALTE|nr:ribosome biogenesis GTPase YlqF [Aestuariibacter sp. P117]MDT0594366.1 ribosome biogenesis GTPase YlqF [Aestuariibacter sp. P117]
MAIQWYPGHMHKAQKEMKELLPKIDLLIEVLDARIPYSSANPAISSLRGNLPCIKVLSKADLADPELTKLWQSYLESEKGVKTITTRTDEKSKMKLVLDLCKKMVPSKVGGVKVINAMIAGIPNVGKSTLINVLAQRVIAKTGNEPAVTKSQQKINLEGGITLFDTPGILWPKVENEHSSYRLAVTGAIKDTIVEYEDIGFYAADYLIKTYPVLLKNRFGLDNIPDTEIAFLEQAATRRGALRSGGRVNLHKICEVLINELRSGMLGLITLEHPDMIQAEELKIKQDLAKKDQDKQDRKQRFKDGSLTPSKREQKQVSREHKANKRRKR